MDRRILLLCFHLALVLGVEELKLLHVIFSHKLYAPYHDIAGENGTSLPQNLTYEYFNFATTNMSNRAKLEMYNVGEYLREVYGEFLTDVYSTRVMKVRTTEFPLSIMSAQLVNAGLWPPSDTQMWNPGYLKWQPIPSDYLRIHADTLLLGTLCPHFQSELENLLNTNETQDMISRYSPLIDRISNETGINITSPLEIALLYSAMEAFVDRDLLLPSWAEDVFPHGDLYNLTILAYDLLSRTPLQRRLNGGPIVKEIISNCMDYIDGKMSEERKLMMYSGDDRNIVGILKNLHVWEPHIPLEGATLIFELYYDNDTDVHGIKIKYYTGTTSGESNLLMMPGCPETCPIERFADIAFTFIPLSEDELCGLEIADQYDEGKDFNSDEEESNDVNENSASLIYDRRHIVFNLMIFITGYFIAL